MRDAPLGEFKRKLAYKTSWYGSVLILADRWYPSSKTCSACGHVQTIGRKKQWDLRRAAAHTHDRDRKRRSKPRQMGAENNTNRGQSGPGAPPPSKAGAKAATAPPGEPG